MSIPTKERQILPIPADTIRANSTYGIGLTNPVSTEQGQAQDEEMLIKGNVSLPQSKFTNIRFWDGLTAEIDLADIKRTAMWVKGSVCPEPLRFLEVYQDLGANPAQHAHDLTRSPVLQQGSDFGTMSWRTVEESFLPRIPGTAFRLGPELNQPPYCWRECDPHTLAVNFTYNSSAIYRILDDLVKQRTIPQKRFSDLFNRICLCLAKVYRANDHFVMRHMNNNVSMYLVPKVIEHVLGKHIYDSDRQDEPLTNSALSVSLDLLGDYSSLNIRSLMAVALGKGVSFMERHVRDRSIDKVNLISIQEVFHSYSERPLAIDHRDVLINMIENHCAKKNSFTMTAIVDDTTETVDDLLWMLKVLEQYPASRIEAVINTARVSVNFSLDMMSPVLNAPEFSGLAARLGGQFRLIPTYSPLLALQANCLTPSVLEAIERADAVYVKGANYFETLQLMDKDVFYAFVVHGPISAKYTGLKPYDAVFAYVPAGTTGYVHGDGSHEFRSLAEHAASVQQRSIPFC